MKTTNTCGLLLLQPYHSTSHPLLIFHHHHREQPPGNWHPPFQLTSTTTPTVMCNHHLLLQPIVLHHICRSRRWDSNAESFRTQNFNYDFDEEEEDDDDKDTENYNSWEQGFDVLEDYIDSIWIFKVFRSFGWALPFILASILLATGLKAFLMALALPLGQSTFSFAFQKMQGEKEKRPKRKTKTKSRSRARSKWGKEKRVGTRGNKKAKMGYQSWVPRRDDSTDPVDNAPNFGGWDELDGRSEFEIDSPSSSGQREGRSQKSPSEKSRLSMRIGKSDTPLLLRLLIAVFPFLGSWTKML